MQRTSPQLFSCHRCQAEVHPVRAKVKVLGARVVRLCRACDERETSSLGSAIKAQVEPPLDAQVELLLDAHTSTSTTKKSTKKSTEAPKKKSSVRARLSTDQILVAVSAVAPAEHVGRPWLRPALGLLALLVSAIPVTTMLSAAAGQSRPSEIAAQLSAPPDSRPATRLLSLSSTPMTFVEPELAPLVDAESWVHPVAGTDELLPSKHTRLFKAERPGSRPSECGQGHCGVDLDAPRGTPIVAVRPGIIEKVMRDPDASGGRYVWIRHDDIDLRTEYFHVDRVAPDLNVGEEVEAGQWLGTLGRSGIEQSAPHLHFTVRRLSRNLRYIDPAPWLTKAEIIEVLDLRLPVATHEAALAP